MAWHPPIKKNIQGDVKFTRPVNHTPSRTSYVKLKKKLNFLLFFVCSDVIFLKNKSRTNYD